MQRPFFNRSTPLSNTLFSPSTSTQPDASFDLGAEPKVRPLRSSSFNPPVDGQLEVANTGSVNDSQSNHHQLTLCSFSIPCPARTVATVTLPTLIPAPILIDLIAYNRLSTCLMFGDTGKSAISASPNSVRLEMAVVKESLNVIARIGGACAPRKAVAEGLGVIFDVSLLSSVPILSM